MKLKTLLIKYGKDISLSQLARESGVPKTTVTDIGAGRTSIFDCRAITVMKIAMAIGCTMEEVMQISSTDELDTEKFYDEDDDYDYSLLTTPIITSELIENSND